MPQGSILAPTLFSIYTHLFSSFLKYCSFHAYADDTQLYLSFDEGDVQTALIKINEDLGVISKLACQHSLVLNPGKTQAILFGGAAACERVRGLVSLTLDGVVVPFVPVVRNLGLYMDNTFRYKQHINNCLKKAYGSMKMLYPHRKYLPLRVKRLLCGSLVLSRLDYCSQVYAAALDVADQVRVQRLQNSCLRFCFGIRKYQHISHKLLDINWLTMQHRFLLRAAVFFHRLIISKEPAYLYRKITFRTDIHNLNIRRKNLIYPPSFKTVLSERSFTFQVYKVYNSVPNSFKCLSVPAFKTAMFRMLWGLQVGDD